jgi:carboxyl-terminal processing protease
MLPANNKGVGMDFGFPDVCLSPAGLIPFPNFSLNAMKLPFSPNVWFSMLPALNMASFSPLTLGDQPGFLHPTFMGQSRHTVGNPRVLINFLPGTSLASPRVGNNFNCPLGLQVLPSLTNVFLTCAAGGGDAARPGRPAVPADIDGLLASLHPCGEASSLESGWLGPGVGYLRLRRFSLDVPARAHVEIGALLAGGLEVLVLDLRNNPGGELTAFVELAGDFLEPGSVLARAIDADGDEVVHRSSHRDPWRMPLWILVDRGTASAAELFAGCLQWHGRAVLAGEKTYGKGAALTVAPEPATGAPVLASVAVLALPDGQPIQDAGVRPDLKLPSPGS